MSQRTADAGRPTALVSPLSKLSTSDRMGMVIWHRSKAIVNRLLGNAPPKIPKTRESTFCLPYEIVEMITAHLTSDPATLKACSLTCRSWYALVLPHIHSTLHLGDMEGVAPHDNLRPLSKLYELGLTPLVKEIFVKQGYNSADWFLPCTFRNRDLSRFSSFSNVQSLKIQRLDLNHFMPYIKHYFEQFSPTLRSIALFSPYCTAPQQLSHFLSLFPNLDDINITYFRPPNNSDPHQELIPFSAPKLRGDLTLDTSHSIEIWLYLVAACGGLRFRFVELYRVGDCAQIILEECAGTLETLKFYLTDCQDHSHSSHLNLSRLKVLRSLEVGGWGVPLQGTDTYRIMMEIFSTVTSPVFSELVIVLRSDQFLRLLLDSTSFEALRMVHRVRSFKLVFLLYIYHLPHERQRVFERALETASAGGLLNFLDSPPVVRSAKIPTAGEKLGPDWMNRPLLY